MSFFSFCPPACGASNSRTAGGRPILLLRRSRRDSAGRLQYDLTPSCFAGREIPHKWLHHITYLPYLQTRLVANAGNPSSFVESCHICRSSGHRDLCQRKFRTWCIACYCMDLPWLLCLTVDVDTHSVYGRCAVINEQNACYFRSVQQGA